MTKFPPFVFYLVLRSAARVDLPLNTRVLFPKKYQSGVTTSGHTTMFCHHDLTDFYVPAKGKEFKGLSTSADADAALREAVSLLETLDSPGLLESKPCAPSFTYLHQTTPFQAHSFRSVNQPIYVFGLYNATAEMLAVTNLPDFDALLARSAPMEFFLHRFKQDLATCYFALNTKRLVARWARWATSPNSSLKTPAERFNVLDQSLFPLITPTPPSV